MDYTLRDLRIAVLINLFELTEGTLQDACRNEIWCLRHDVPTEGLEDITYADCSTAELLQMLRVITPRTSAEQSAMLVCTLREIS